MKTHFDKELYPIAKDLSPSQRAALGLKFLHWADQLLESQQTTLPQPPQPPQPNSEEDSRWFGA